MHERCSDAIDGLQRRVIGCSYVAAVASWVRVRAAFKASGFVGFWQRKSAKKRRETPLRQRQ
jgi:hypothetical protein